MKSQTEAAQRPASGQATGVKGPRVWMDMDQVELDAAYDQSVYAPNREQILKRYATNSEAVRARLGAPRRYAYGPAPSEGLDVYTTARPERRSTSSSTAAGGARASPGTTPSPPSCSCTPVRTSWCPTSPGCRTWAGA